MSMSKRLSQSGQEEPWARLADEMGGQFVKRSRLLRLLGGRSDEVVAKVNGWTMVLDYVRRQPRLSGSPLVHEYCTRMQAFYIGETDFRFSIRGKGILSGLGKLAGMQDIEIGDPDFDRDFWVKSNDESAVRALLGEPAIRRSLELQRSIRPFSLWAARCDDEFEVLGHPEERLHRLLFTDKFVDAPPTKGTDTPRLKSIFELLAAILNRLRDMEVASEVCIDWQ